MHVQVCNDTDDWSEMTDCKVRVDGAWKQCTAIHANVDGAWKKVWPVTKVTITSDALTLTAGTYTEDAITKLFWPNTEAYIEAGAATADTCKFIVTASNITGDNADTWQVPENTPLRLLVVDENGNYLTTTDAAGQQFAFCINIMLGSEECSFTEITSDGCDITVTVSYLSTDTPYKSWAVRYGGEAHFIGIVNGEPANINPTYSDDMDALSIAIPEGTYHLVVLDINNAYDDVIFDNQLGSVIVKEPDSITITSENLTLTTISTYADLENALTNANFTVTVTDKPDGWVVPTSSTSNSTESTLVLNLVDSDGNIVQGNTTSLSSNLGIEMLRGEMEVSGFLPTDGGTVTTTTETYGSDTTWTFTGNIIGYSENTDALSLNGTYTLVLDSAYSEYTGLDNVEVVNKLGTIYIK